jgi:hypothetical protein
MQSKASLKMLSKSTPSVENSSDSIVPLHLHSKWLISRGCKPLIGSHVPVWGNSNLANPCRILMLNKNNTPNNPKNILMGHLRLITSGLNQLTLSKVCPLSNRIIRLKSQLSQKETFIMLNSIKLYIDRVRYKNQKMTPLGFSTSR